MDIKVGGDSVDNLTQSQKDGICQTLRKAYRWTVAVDIVQHRSHGEDMPLAPVFSSTYTVESDLALSVAEGLERCVRQERCQEEGP